MNVQTVETKARKRQSVKASKPSTAKTLATTVHLSPEAAQRIDLHALMTGQSRSAYIESLIMTHCRRYVVSDRGGCDNGSIGEAGSAA